MPYDGEFQERGDGLEVLAEYLDHLAPNQYYQHTWDFCALGYAAKLRLNGLSWHALEYDRIHFGKLTYFDAAKAAFDITAAESGWLFGSGGPGHVSAKETAARIRTVIEARAARRANWSVKLRKSLGKLVALVTG